MTRRFLSILYSLTLASLAVHAAESPAARIPFAARPDEGAVQWGRAVTC
jgi:hypothetical protein